MGEGEGLGQLLGAPMASVPKMDEVLQMLLEGTSPEELVAMGVPEEVVEAAMMEIQKQTAAVPQGQQQGGLGSMMAQPSMPTQQQG